MWKLLQTLEEADMLVFPNNNHSFEASKPYFMRREWDYFVKHLLGEEPPKEYKITIPEL